MTSVKIGIRGIVLTWTILTTTFFWTSTMRILLKPEISSWSIFSVGGKGFMGEFWLPPLIVILALFMFYLEGRGRLRPLFHTLLLGWHLTITGAFIYGSLQTDSMISFGTWGISLSFIWLVFPLAIFSVLAIVMVIQEIRGRRSVPVHEWNRINWSAIAIAALLLPVALILFRLGTGFNWIVKLAVATTIIQWILLAEAVGRPELKEPKKKKI